MKQKTLIRIGALIAVVAIVLGAILPSITL